MDNINFNHLVAIDSFKIKYKEDDTLKAMSSKLVEDQIQHEMKTGTIAFIAQGVRQHFRYFERN
ncbi:hypothetical protein GS16_00395 [Candidatus Liberibacter solanacearum]|uniref:hypothetical protein n=1 Tax=Candidatus Liberibacter solanacearum TaxID=556287 RepID=UPI0005039400|nr:hypothetical protein [Candidatus Liberibacter solanacearum]KGB27976.1 hypothetical protein GS16_00395 [Candidatus Liberibacter solanacearum]